jgi:hypothetical protein
MVKAGLDTSLPWNAGRKWWQVSAAPSRTAWAQVLLLSQALIPRRLDDIDMRVRLPSSARARGDYVVVPDDGGDRS